MTDNEDQLIVTVTLYHRSDDPQTRIVEDDLASLQPLTPHRVVKINVETDPILKERFYSSCPVVEVGPYLVKSPFKKTDLVATLGATHDRLKQMLETNDKKHIKRKQQGSRLTGFDRFSFWFSKWYMLVFNMMVLLYVGLPFLAPVLVKNGHESAARVIYAIYRPFCHQLAFRSWFLFGEQPYYPRELADIPGVLTYEEVTGNDSTDLNKGREVIGNEDLGYKVALCERDIALYGSLLLFGIVFMLTGRKIKALPWYLWVFLGIIPIGLDGGSQLFGFFGWDLPSWMIRESTPFLRTLTGSLFGLMTAWYLYPMIEETMRDTRVILSKKIASVNQLIQEKTS